MKRTLKLLSSMFVTFLVVSLFTAPAAGPGERIGGMSGDVTDSSGAVVPGVTVTLTNASRALKFSQMTNTGGAYRFTNILRVRALRSDVLARRFRHG